MVIALNMRSLASSRCFSIAAAALEAMRTWSDLLDQDIVSLDEATTRLSLSRDGRDVTAVIPHKLLFGTTTLSNYLIYSDESGGLILALSDASGARPTIKDALSVRQPAVVDFSRDANTSRMTLPGRAWPLLVDWNTGEGSVYTTQEQVISGLLPTAAEILSRHQEAQTTQDTRLLTYVADVTMEQRFRTTAADPGYDVVTQNRFFVELYHISENRDNG